MTDIDSILKSLRTKALEDPQFAELLLGTRSDANPVSSFCQVVREQGYPLYEMDLVNAGEEYYANMRRSTNGGGENSPLLCGEDDYYELFMNELEEISRRKERR